MGLKAPVLTASRILDASRRPQAADDIDVTGWPNAHQFIIVAQMDEGAGPWEASFGIRWRDVTDSGAFADLGATGEIQTGTSTLLTNLNPVQVAEKACTNVPVGSSWRDGMELEEGSISATINMYDEYYTELQVAVSPADAQAGHNYEFQLYDYTNVAAIGTLAASITVTGKSPTVVLNTPANEASTEDTTPTFDFTGTDPESNDIRYNFQLDTVNTFTSVSGSPLLLDSYPESNYSVMQGLDYLIQMIGQRFWGDGTYVGSAKFYLRKVGSPPGSAYARIYATTQDASGLRIPTGSPLATSDGIVATSLPTSLELVEFTYSGNQQVLLEDGKPLYTCVYYNGVDDSNYVIVGLDNSSPTHPEISARYFQPSGPWTAQPTHDCIFYLYTYAKTGLLHEISGTDAGFVNPDNGADLDPFTSGENIQFTVQAGDALSPGTYYWRVRGTDPGGSDIWGTYPTYRTLYITSVGPSGVKTINDVAIASVKTINDLPIGSVKTING